MAQRKTRKSTTQANQVEISIPEICAAIITIEGVTPLLTNAWSDAARIAIENGGLAEEDKLPVPYCTPEERFEGSIYYTENGEPGFPASAFLPCVAITAFRLNKKNAQTVTKTVLSVTGARILPIRGAIPKMRKDIVKLPGQSSGTSIAFRAQYDVPWEIDVPIEFFPEKMSLKRIYQLFTLAGKCTGIGAWRPEKDGTFGRFKVKSARDIGPVDLDGCVIE